MISKNRNQLFSFGGALVLFVCITVAGGFAAQALAQQKANSGRQGAAAQNSQGSAGEEAKKSKFGERDSPEQIRKREEWFYKQRAFPNPQIPPGARFRAFQHMQRMMEMEGKLFRRPDGTFAAALAPLAAGTPTWNPIGPMPTAGGFFSPVTGRVTAIAVDPSDTTGNTVLVGGAQGGVWRSTDGGATWTATGDTNPSLAMGSIAFAPSQPTTVYAGTGEQASTGFDVYYGAGVLKSTNSGVTWTPTCATPGPTCPFIGPFSSGFFPGGGARISYLAVNPTNPNLILAGVQIFTGTNSAGVYCSNDGGLNWTNILPGQMATFVGFASSSVAFVALGRPFGSASGQTNANGIYKSSNANGNCSAITFQNLTTLANSGLPTTNVGRIDMGIDSTGNTVYASIADSSAASDTNLGIWKTVNGGTTWTRTAAPDICRQQCWYDNVVKVDPNNSNTVFFGGSAVAQIQGGTVLLPQWVQRSTDGGTTWSSAIPSFSLLSSTPPGIPHVDVHAFAFFRATTGPNAGKTILYMGNDGGVWRTNDAEAPTVSWTNLNQSSPPLAGLQLTQFYPSLSIHPSNPNIAFAGAQDNGSQDFGVSLSALTWTDNQTCGDGGWTVVDPATPSTVYVLCQFIDINRSVNNGVPGSFTSAINGITDAPTSANFIPPIAIDPANPQRVYFGTTKVWQTVDGANSWTAISPDLVTSPFSIVALGVGGNTGNVVYVGTDDGKVFVATNVTPGSGVFNNMSAGLPGRAVTQIVVDPADTSGLTAYVMMSGFSGFSDQAGHIFKTTTGGTTWTDLSTGLPNIPVNDLVIDPDVAGSLYAATDLGVFQGTSCTGVSCIWVTFNNNSLPNVAVFSLRLHRASRVLMAATHGRGAWSLVLNNFAFTGPHISELTPASTTAGAASATILVDGSNLSGGTVLWDGSQNPGVTTTEPVPGELQATVASSLLNAAGTHQITVQVVPQASNALTFTVMNPVPTINANGVTPNSATAGQTTDVNITITGSNFVSSSKATWNGSTAGVTTNPVTSSTQITAMLSHTLFFGGANFVGVFNPTPGGGSSNDVAFNVTQTTPPPNDNFANATNVSSTPFTNTVDSFAATTETTDPTPSTSCVPAGSSTNPRTKTVWYMFLATGNGTITADTVGSAYDTILTVVTGSPGNFTQVACNDDIQLGIVLQSRVTFSATQGTTYFFMISPFDPTEPGGQGLGGKAVFNLSANLVPTTDFALAGVSGQTSKTVTAGQQAQYPIDVLAFGGFNGTVNLSCTLTAAHTTCAANPASVTQSGRSTITVTTTARGGMPPAGPWRVRPQPIFVPLLALIVAVLILLTKVRARRVRLALSLPLAALVLLLVFQAAGCSGGGGGGGGATGTPAGTYTVTVTGTSGATSHSVPVTLVVN